LNNGFSYGTISYQLRQGQVKSMEKRTDLPLPTAERLPRYFRYILERKEAGQHTVSSEEIGLALNLDPAQVRKDLSMIWGKGRAGIGYEIHPLLERLEDFLGTRREKKAVLVGAGRLGTALACYPGFHRYGLRITAVFEKDPEKIATLLCGIPVLSEDELENYLDQNHVLMGIIAVPADAAQRVAEKLAAAGVRAIWNFAPTTLRLNKPLIIRDEDLGADLAVLAYQMTHQNEEE
jgi:redox-sensing transcriptional repressor